MDGAEGGGLRGDRERGKSSCRVGWDVLQGDIHDTLIYLCKTVSKSYQDLSSTSSFQPPPRHGVRLDVIV